MTEGIPAQGRTQPERVGEADWVAVCIGVPVQAVSDWVNIDETLDFGIVKTRAHVQKSV